MKPVVSLCALPDYDPSRVRDALQLLLEPLGGMANFVEPGRKVLLKPNMLAGKAPEKAVTTHPEIVRQTILLAQQAGGVVSVGDSPGLGKPEGVAVKCGISSVIEETGARFAPFSQSVPIDLESGTFHHLEVARDALDSDLIINLPKLKTHQMMGYTGAVKNMFGLVVGMRKARLHLQAGVDKAFFALMLHELAARFKPALSIMDAVVGMQGNGPGNGDPVQIGALLASSEAVALDTVALELTGLPRRRVCTQLVAVDAGMTGATLDDIDLCGPSPRQLRPASFRPAKQSDVNFGLPAPLKQSLRKILTARPAIGESCRLCGHCVSHCPPQAMRRGQDRVQIDYNRCIRCFCCQELCPYNAISTRQGILLKLAELFGARH
jgi:uncharacterized protein (DUF362 family)